MCYLFKFIDFCFFCCLSQHRGNDRPDGAQKQVQQLLFIIHDCFCHSENKASAQITVNFRLGGYTCYT